MFHKPEKPHYPYSEFRTVEFLEPTRLRIRRKDGREELMGYGIGERVRVLIEADGALVCGSMVRRSEIPMEDGSVIFDWSEPEPQMKFVL